MLKVTIKYRIANVFGEAMHDHLSDLAKGTYQISLGSLGFKLEIPR